MNDKLVTHEMISVDQEIADELLTEAFHLVNNEGQLSLRLWILLSRQPDVTSSLKELIERGLLKMEIRIRNPFLLLNSRKAKVEKSELQVYHKKNDRVIQSLNGFGSEHVFRFNVQLSADECDEARKALTDQTSAIHLRGYVIFLEDGKRKEARFLIPLRKIFNRSFKDLGNEGRQSRILVRYFDPESVSYKDAPVFITNRSAKSRSTLNATTRMIRVRNDLINPALVVKPVSSKFTKINNMGISVNPKNKLWYLDDIKIKTGADVQQPSLPVVKDDEETAWADPADPKKVWYLPEYRVVEPLQTDTRDSSPFLMTFKKTGSDSSGKPVLNGTAVISLSQNIPDAASARAKSIPGSKLVPVITSNQTFVLQIPFTDKNGTQGTSDLTPSEITIADNIVKLNFQLTDNWIRNCYGVLSIDSFQQRKAQIKVFTCFSGLGRIKKSNIKFLASAGFVKVPMLKNKSTAGGLFFDVSKRSLSVDGQYINFPDSVKSRGTLFQPNISGKIVKSASVSATSILVAKQGSKLPPEVEKGDELAERSFANEQVAEVFFACNAFGQFYIEEHSDGSHKSIGCYEPYRIGEIQFRMYEEMTSLATPYYKIHRSLQSPDHFLVQPSRYRITRFDASHPGMAFKPCVHMYGAIDEEDNFQNSLCILDMCLEPDIPTFEFHLLKQELKKQCNKKPVIEFPGEIMEDAEFNWSLPSGTRVETLNLGRAVQVTVTVDIMQVLTLQAILKNGSLNGQAVYSMADGSKYSINLNPDTANITGPWEVGPLAAIKKNSSVEFRNSTEKKVQLSKVVRSDRDGNDIEVLQVNKALFPGESVNIPVSGAVETIVVDCTPEIQAAELDETLIFIDDLTCQIIFSTDIDFIQRKVTGIEVEASFSDGPVKTYSGQLTSSDPALEFESYIPVTKVAGPRMISYRARALSDNNTRQFSEWKQWSVREQGSIINLTSDLLFKI